MKLPLKNWASAFVLSFLLVALSGCLSPKDGHQATRPGDDSEGIGGYIVKPSQARPECTAEKKSDTSFELVCRVLTTDGKGKAVEASGIDPDIRVTWSDPRSVDGSLLQVGACVLSPSGLVRTCELTLRSESRVQVDLRLENTVTGEASERSDVLLLSLTGTEDKAYFGVAVAGGGDVDGDQYADLLVGAYLADAGGVDRGQAFVYSGRTGGVLFALGGTEDKSRFGYALTWLGDLNGDGKPEFAVGAWGTGESRGEVLVFNGADGGVLRVLSGTVNEGDFGISVACPGDVNGDGTPDLIVGADKAGKAYVYSGRDFSLLHSLSGSQAAGRFGISVSGAGDLDGDGKADLLVGEFASDRNGIRDSGSVHAFSGADGRPLFSRFGAEPSGFFGYAVAGTGDLNSDGKPDLLVGEYGADAGGVNRGRVHILSGSDGSTLRSLSGAEDQASFGRSLATVGDLDGDGKSDFIVGAYLADGGGLDRGMAQVFSGASGQELRRLNGKEDQARMGFSVGAAGDVNSDGRPDLIVGEYASDGNGRNRGKVYLLSGTDGAVLTVAK